MKVIYLTPSSFRTINAGALRNLSIANSLALGGHEVIILNSDAPKQEIPLEWEGLCESGVVIQNSGPSKSRLISRIQRQLLGPMSAKPQFSSHDVVIAYNPGPLTYFLIRRQSRLHRARLVLDISEFLTMRDLPGSWLSPYSWLYELFMRLLPHLLGKDGKSLAISRPMADWLGSKGASVLEVPPLSLAIPKGKEETIATRKIVLGGSGLANKGKDSEALMLLLELAETTPDVLEGFEFQVLGNLDEYTSRRIASIVTEVNITQSGWVEWGHAIQAVEAADWLLLLRDPKRRRNRLGFPSKITESLSLGTPVIANKCGNNTDYLVDGQNSVFVKSLTSSSLAVALVTARCPRIPGPDKRFTTSKWTKKLSTFIFDK